MKVSDIKIKRSFIMSKPSADKINACRKYFEENGKLDSDIVLDEDGYLVDGYIRYLVLVENNIEEIKVVKNKKIYHTIKTYVYGRHPNSKKEYVWKVPQNFIGDIVVGNKVLVSTRYGIMPITVTKIEKSSTPPKSPSRIRKVLECLKS